MDRELDILLRGFIALILGGLLGWEREAAGKAAGLRTHMLVALASALFVVLGELLVEHFAHYGDKVRFDPLRSVEAVVTGISFLGAGSIFVAGREQRVKGLTTAAAILVTAAVGMFAGLRMYLLAIGLTLLTLIVLAGVKRLWDRAAGRKEDTDTRSN